MQKTLKLKFFKGLLLMVALFLFLCNGKVIKAAELVSEKSEVQTHTEVEVIAHVPEGMKDDIWITFEEVESGTFFSTSLVEFDDYIDYLNLWGGKKYYATIEIEQEGNWKNDLKPMYEIPNGDPIVIEFTIIDAEKDESIEENATASFADNELDLKAEAAIKEFIDDISFIQNDQSYEVLLMVAEGELSRQSFIQDNVLNTQERWDSMSKFDKFIWRRACYDPIQSLLRNESKVGSNQFTLDDFVKDANSGCLSIKDGGYTDGEKVYNAIVKWDEFLYDYFLQTGRPFDYFNGTKNYVDVKSPSEQSELDQLREELLSDMTDDQKKELKEEIKQEAGSKNDEQKNENSSLKKAVKGSIISIILLIIVGVAYFIVKKINQKKNIYDNTKN